ncbi:MAG: PAS domain S-box protein [Pontiellaceae bacterium]|nr:PAS domain S-box protein [Pontiellaceae bacterium]MBN2785030.1 PAS domain S-box protein [Pontiellaceae bacterium]
MEENISNDCVSRRLEQENDELRQQIRALASKLNDRCGRHESSLLSGLLDSMPDIVFFKDFKGVYLGCNTHFAEFVGCSREEIVGHTDYDLFPVAVAEFFRGQDAAMMADGKKRSNDEWVDYPDGRRVLLDTLKAPLRDASGTLIGLLGISRDITERRRFEEDLQLAKQQYQYIVDNTLDVIYQTDLKGNCIYVNAAAFAMTGYTEQELLNMNISDLVAPEYQMMVYERLQARIMGDHEEGLYCFDIIRKDGRHVLVELYTRSVFSDDGQLQAVQGVARDITERRKAEVALELRESYQSAILENLPGLVWLKDRDSRFLSVNGSFAEACGMEHPSDLCGKSDADIWPPELAEQYQLDDKVVMAQGTSVRVEEPIEHEGHRLWVETFKTPVIDARGDVIGTVGYAQDITHRKKSEEQIRRLSSIQRELMRLATGFVNIPVAGQDAAIKEALHLIGTLIGADRAYLFSYDWQNQIMSNTHEWCAGEISPEIENLQDIPVDVVPDWVGAHRKGKIVHVPCVNDLLESSNLRAVLEPQGIKSLITIPLMDQSVCLGFVGFDAVKAVRDWQEEELGLLRVMAEMFANFKIRRSSEEKLARFTEKQSEMIEQMQAMQQDLLRACEESKEAARAKSMFLANMSHEIRTPLNAILGYSQILRRSCGGSRSNAVCSKGLNVILDSGNHLLELINDVLLLSRNESTHVELSSVDFYFRPLLEEIRQMFDQHPDAENLAIELEVEESLPACIHADNGKIRQVLINLVGNAVKFTPAGWVRITAALREQARGAGGLMVELTVEDTGVGIEADGLENIFSAFEQAASGRSTGKGTGLGLAISRQYARAMSGNIVVESTVGKGSRFCFSFLADECAAKPATADPRRIISLAADEPVRRLLLVEDDKNSLEMLALLLGSIGFKTEMATNGEEALERLAEDPEFDLVLLDKKMPKLNGTETLKAIRSNPALKGLPVLVMTASAHPDDEQMLMSIGANGFLPKPLRDAQLLQGIEQAVGVRYRYETVARPPEKQQPSSFVPMVELLPGNLVKDCLAVVRRGYVQGLRELIKQVSDEQPELGAYMSRCADSYDYSALETLLKEKESR